MTKNFWGYIHSSGVLHAKRWHGDHKDYTEDVINNPFMPVVFPPFEAASQPDALRKMREMMRPPVIRSKPLSPLGEGDRANFATLRAAVKNNDLALVRSRRKADGKDVALVCAMGRDGEGNILPSPLAVMVEGNPFEDFEDPLH